MAVVDDDEVVVVDDEKVVVSSFSFDLHLVAFNSASCCGDNDEDVAAVVVVVEIACAVVVCFLPSLASSSSFFGTGLFLASAAFLNFVHSLRCPPFFQWFTWQSRPQYCTVWHNLQGCNGRNGVLGLPQVEQQRMVGVVRPSCLSKI